MLLYYSLWPYFFKHGHTASYQYFENLWKLSNFNINYQPAVDPQSTKQCFPPSFLAGWHSKHHWRHPTKEHSWASCLWRMNHVKFIPFIKALQWNDRYFWVKGGGCRILRTLRILNKRIMEALKILRGLHNGPPLQFTGHKALGICKVSHSTAFPRFARKIVTAFASQVQMIPAQFWRVSGEDWDRWDPFRTFSFSGQKTGAASEVHARFTSSRKKNRRSYDAISSHSFRMLSDCVLTYVTTSFYSILPTVPTAFVWSVDISWITSFQWMPCDNLHAQWTSGAQDAANQTIHRSNESKTLPRAYCEASWGMS